MSMGYGSVNVGYPIKPNNFEAAGSVAQHNQDSGAHADIRAELAGTLKASIKVSYNEEG